MADDRRIKTTSSSKKVVDPPTFSTDGKVTTARVQQKKPTQDKDKDKKVAQKQPDAEDPFEGTSATGYSAEIRAIVMSRNALSRLEHFLNLTLRYQRPAGPSDLVAGADRHPDTCMPTHMISNSESDKDQMEFAVDEDQVNLLFGEDEKEVEDDWLEQIAQNYEEEETGPDIGAALATVVEKILKTTIRREN